MITDSSDFFFVLFCSYCTFPPKQQYQYNILGKVNTQSNDLCVGQFKSAFHIWSYLWAAFKVFDIWFLHKLSFKFANFAELTNTVL